MFIHLINRRFLFPILALGAIAFPMPNTGEPIKDGQSLQAAIEAAIHSGSTQLTLQGQSVRMGDQLIRIAHAKNLTIDGRGATLVFSNLSGNSFTVRHCTNLTLKNLTIQCDPLPFTQGTILDVDSKKGHFTFELDQGYPDLTKDYLVRHAHIFTPQGQWRPGVPDVYTRKITPENLRRGRAEFPPGTPGMDLVQSGDKVALNRRTGGSVFRIEASDTITLEGLTIHAGPGPAFLGRFLRGAITISNCHITPGPPPNDATANPLMSNTADGLNFAYCRNGPTITGCDFSFMGDDAINLHGVALPVLKVEDQGRSIITARPYRHESFDYVIETGDEARFLDSANYAVSGKQAIASWSTIEPIESLLETAKSSWTFANAKGVFTFYRVTFKDPVQAKPGDFFDLPAIAASGFVIEDNHFHDHRARGIRLMASDGLIRRNRIERVKQMAITVGPSYAFWREAGWVSDVEISENVIRDVCQGQRSFASNAEALGAIAVTIRPDKGKSWSDTPMPLNNERIVIKNNLIDGASTAGIFLRGARDVEVAGNTISRTNYADLSRAGRSYGLKVSDPIDVDLCESVSIHGNVLQDVGGQKMTEEKAAP